MFDHNTLQNTHFRFNPDWLKRLRTQALQTFVDRGFPSRKEEAWKYINLAPLEKTIFKTVESSQLPEQKAENHPTSPLITFFNGVFQPHASHLEGLNDQVVLMPLSEALYTHENQIRPFLETYDTTVNPFVSLNTAFLSEGIFLWVPPHTLLEKPIHFLHINQQEGMWHTRNIVIVNENAQVTLLEHFKGHKALYFNNTVTQIHQSSGSLLNYYKIQQESRQAYHLANIQINQARNSKFTSFHATLGGQLSRDDLQVKLQGKGAHCDLKGFYATKQDQCVDHHLITEHLAENTQSNQYFKGLLKDRSKAIFNGKVKVYKSAHQTVAHQSNQNILLSNAAEVDTKPELEIDNENVKCIHGATVGPLAQDAIFYLQSRGLSQEQATHLLIKAFLNELITPIPFLEIVQLLNDLKADFIKT